MTSVILMTKKLVSSNRKIISGVTSMIRHPLSSKLKIARQMVKMLSKTNQTMDGVTLTSLIQRKTILLTLLRSPLMSNKSSLISSRSKRKPQL